MPTRPLIELTGKKIKLIVENDLRLIILARDDQRLWESSKSIMPLMHVRRGSVESAIPVASGKVISESEYADCDYRGRRVRLSNFAAADVAIEFVVAIHAQNDTVMIQAEQVGGADTIVAIEHLYRFEKSVSDGGYMILPRGSGYLIPADCPDELPGEGRKNFGADHSYMVGGCWSMPLFGMVRGKDALCAIVETWWDCAVNAEHVPGETSALDFHWRPSLGKLSYPRRLLLRFDERLDYAGMAKLYREHAAKQGLVRTLEEKAEQTPVIRRYLENILFRWQEWNADEADAVLADMRRLQAMGFGLNFFFPKWNSATDYTEGEAPVKANSIWHAWLLSNPVPDWPTLAAFLNAVQELGCPVQAMIRMLTQTTGCVGYDEARWPLDANGRKTTDILSTSDDLDRLKEVFDHRHTNRMNTDLLYFDGYSAHGSVPENFSPEHPVTRRETFETQNACFAETRRRGIMPGAELARFWAIADCDYFFYTDWSADRLGNGPTQGASAPIGEPIPLFQLIFHDCYIAGFPSGGHKIYVEGVDWWADRTPRLYELLFCAAPAHNWLPDGQVPIPDWESRKTQRRWAWLKRWNAYYRAIATSEMVSHEFVSADRRKQRIEFANGVVAEFDMTANRFRVEGVPDFTGDWESPEEL